MASQVEVVIIGAGASGLMCAIEAGKRGRKVLVLDHAKKPGRKILISGGGKCNFTNNDVSAHHFLCQNPHFVKSALSQYTNWDFISLVSKYGIDFEEREHGQLFCRESAKDIVNMLLKECQQAMVRFQYQVDIHSIKQNKMGFSLYANSEKIECESLVIATGGLSMPKLGATPFGYKVAEQFGLSIVPTAAGLVPFTFQKEDKESLANLSGISTLAEVSTNGGTTFKEALLFTHRGLSGPSILQSSSFWKAGQTVSINLIPETDLLSLLTLSRENHPNQSLKNTLAKVLPKRLVEALISRKTITDKPLKQMNEKDIMSTIQALELWQIKPNGTEGYRTSEVTLGGINTDNISSKTMESKDVKGLFFIGEVLDVAGWLGGYNFQFAWSSGFVAGRRA